MGFEFLWVGIELENEDVRVRIHSGEKLLGGGGRKCMEVEGASKVGSERPAGQTRWNF